MTNKSELTVPLRLGNLSQEDTCVGEDDDDDGEFNEDGMPWFYVNQSGFPMDSFTWERMWGHIAKIHPDSQNVVNSIRKMNELPEKPFPQAPLSFPPNTSVPDKLEAIQNYMKELEYPFSN